MPYAAATLCWLLFMLVDSAVLEGGVRFGLSSMQAQQCAHSPWLHSCCTELVSDALTNSKHRKVHI